MPKDVGEDSERIYERFQLIVNGPALFNAVVTGLDLDIFGFLSRHPGSTFEDLREATGLLTHKLRVLMLALCSTELVDRREGRYTNSAVAEELLAPNSTESWRHILPGWQKIYYPAFPHMTEALRSGTNTLALAAHPGTEPTLYQRLAHNPELQEALHTSMAAFTLRSLPALLDNPEIATVSHLLDVGGGDGTTARRLAARHTGMRVTVFDMPSVTRLAGDPAATGVERVGLHPGDIFQDAFPHGADGVLFSHVLEVFSPEEITGLLVKAFRALPSGGKVFLYGFNIPEEENRGVLSARLSLYLNVLATGQGMAYPAQDYERWCEDAGFSDVKSFTDLPYEHGLTVGTKA
ncbi:methyltransferase [Sinosporangium siamense]|uniref:SAM-dependent methyltransferase n=1 Tax=Sinosporangium siamense TaxID=1367973 RepID=A0A919RJ56_9ACTN|nr:methyltransferase [Sinosporangium siamense]GII92844.1 SAM-dependent methyltransferase [Sinosporangium siamense]